MVEKEKMKGDEHEKESANGVHDLEGTKVSRKKQEMESARVVVKAPEAPG